MPDFPPWFWPSAVLTWLVGQLATALLIEPLKPRLRDILPSGLAWHRERRVKRLVHEYRYLRQRRDDGTLIFFVLERSHLALMRFVLVSILWVVGTLFLLVLWQLGAQRVAEQHTSFGSGWVPGLLLGTVLGPATGFVVHRFLSEPLAAFSAGNRAAIAPQDFRENTLKTIRRLQPDFDETMLDGPGPDKWKLYGWERR